MSNKILNLEVGVNTLEIDLLIADVALNWINQRKLIFVTEWINIYFIRSVINFGCFLACLWLLTISVSRGQKSHSLPRIICSLKIKLPTWSKCFELRIA